MNNEYFIKDVYNRDLQSEFFLNYMRSQERIAINALFRSKTLEVNALGLSLTNDLNQASTDMKDYASNTYANNIKEGFQGAAAESANTYLTQTLTAPDLKSPIK
ncbi:hypothetical protein [Streptococcus sp. CSL10205-OR2]|uniref:hypothetical protein n=1 Tax=Streptococcus sp. CSL10205-OR2 TaxID=2980558 RepID=UPI0021D89093|nr:hypothetical protein [Streptococcus sp. CSL10205-OR2]MCU9533562.1 hypothetical protein [Streptococcus sp. CSL10205-OR2]